MNCTCELVISSDSCSPSCLTLVGCYTLMPFVLEEIEEIAFELIKYRTYSPDLASSDF